MWSALALAPLNHLLGQQSWATRRLVPFAGAQGRFRFAEAGNIAAPQVAFRIGADGLLEEAPGETFDVDVTLPWLALVSLADGPEKVLGQAQISGRAELAEALREVFRYLRPDFEDDLARLIGDVPARRIFDWAARQAEQLKRATDALNQGLMENLQHEAQVLPSRNDYERFKGEALTLQQAMDAMALRLERLERAR